MFTQYEYTSYRTHNFQGVLIGLNTRGLYIQMTLVSEQVACLKQGTVIELPSTSITMEKWMIGYDWMLWMLGNTGVLCSWLGL